METLHISSSVAPSARHQKHGSNDAEPGKHMKKNIITCGPFVYESFGHTSQETKPLGRENRAPNVDGDNISPSLLEFAQAQISLQNVSSSRKVKTRELGSILLPRRKPSTANSQWKFGLSGDGETKVDYGLSVLQCFMPSQPYRPVKRMQVKRNLEHIPLHLCPGDRMLPRIISESRQRNISVQDDTGSGTSMSGTQLHWGRTKQADANHVDQTPLSQCSSTLSFSDEAFTKESISLPAFTKESLSVDNQGESSPSSSDSDSMFQPYLTVLSQNAKLLQHYTASAGELKAAMGRIGGSDASSNRPRTSDAVSLPLL